MQSSCHSPGGIHAAIIMDGNGRWAEARGLPRTAGHRAGAGAVRRIVEAAPGAGIGTLTLFSFSSDNWRRPRAEVVTLFSLLRRYLANETERCVEQGVRMSFLGRRRRLPSSLRRDFQLAEARTRAGRRLHLRLAVDFSGRDSILRAARLLSRTRNATRTDFAHALAPPSAGGAKSPDVDLLVRTGGEQRLSDFLLWECAYAELVFSEKPWPDFQPDDLRAAVAELVSRERRFGGVPGTLSGEGEAASDGAPGHSGGSRGPIREASA